MSPTRTIIAGLITASLAGPAFAQCMQAAERPAFDVRALQSQLMVLALTCGQQDQYNRFVTENRTVLGSAYRDLERHFRRAGGQRALDAYITNTANIHSQAGISQGSLFCANQQQLFPAALAVRSRDQLAALSQERQIRHAYEPPTCGTGTGTGTTTARAPRAERPAAARPAPARPAPNRSTAAPAAPRS